MGRIVPVIYKKTDCKVEDCIKGYWYQNILDSSNMEEYTDYQIEQRRLRDNNIHDANQQLGVHGKVDTCIFGPSIDGTVVLSLEIW